MRAQYEYPTGCTQSLPPQSDGMVRRTPCVLYGAGKVKRPRPAGRKPRFVTRVRDVEAYDFSKKPPGKSAHVSPGAKTSKHHSNIALHIRAHSRRLAAGLLLLALHIHDRLSRASPRRMGDGCVRRHRVRARVERRG